MPKGDYGIGACYPKQLTALDDSPVVLVQAGATLIYAVNIRNTTAAVAYVQFFDAAVADVTLGTTTPIMALSVAASGVTNVQLSKPALFPTACSVASTTTATGNTGAATDVVVFYA